jgi:hypothetical protein
MTMLSHRLARLAAGAVSLCLLLLMTAPAGASTVVVHSLDVYSASHGVQQGTSGAQAGYIVGTPADSAHANTINIVPGNGWSNFVSAASAGMPYSIASIVFTHTSGMFYDTTVLSHAQVRQEGGANVRLRWPLLYDLPGSSWKLEVRYATPWMWDDDGSGPNPPTWVHVDSWKWTLKSDVDHLDALLDLFHSLPRGIGQGAILSDEELYARLKAHISQIRQAESISDYFEAGEHVGDMELLILDSGDGIQQTAENPARDRILAEIEGLGPYGLIDP